MAERFNDPWADAQLRDKFAGQALVGLMSNRGFLDRAEAAALKKGVSSGAIIAEIAFSVATEMVKRSRALPIEDVLTPSSEVSHG
ncbi:hypothetical protein [Xanthobacter aminoxidans]|uniref:hypothetical protein n=1 Tax=Xanthobacter aminoxidans TaxID=186280 RepID=UPI00372B0025